MVKTLKKSSPPEPIDRWPWNLVCSIVYAGATKIVQSMTLGWSWPILGQGQIWSHRLLYGNKRKLLFFWNYCSLRSQSWLKHSDFQDDMLMTYILFDSYFINYLQETPDIKFDPWSDWTDFGRPAKVKNLTRAVTIGFLAHLSRRLRGELIV